MDHTIIYLYGIFNKLYFAAESGMGRKKARRPLQSCKIEVMGAWSTRERRRWEDR